MHMWVIVGYMVTEIKTSNTWSILTLTCAPALFPCFMPKEKKWNWNAAYKNWNMQVIKLMI